MRKSPAHVFLLPRYTLVQDTQGNVMELSDASGNELERYEYDPYGNRRTYQKQGSNWLPIFQSTYDSWYGYTGRRHDPETGLMYYRNRYYSPYLGRFITHDPIGLWTDGRNWGNGYASVGNQGQIGLDPLGLRTQGPGQGGPGQGPAPAFDPSTDVGFVPPGLGDVAIPNLAPQGPGSAQGKKQCPPEKPKEDKRGWLSRFLGAVIGAPLSIASLPVAAIVELAGGDGGAVIEGAFNIGDTVGDAMDSGGLGVGIENIVEGGVQTAVDVVSGNDPLASLGQVAAGGQQVAMSPINTGAALMAASLSGFSSPVTFRSGSFQIRMRRYICSSRELGAITFSSFTFMSPGPNQMGADGLTFWVHEPMHVLQALLGGPLYVGFGIIDVGIGILTGTGGTPVLDALGLPGQFR